MYGIGVDFLLEQANSRGRGIFIEFLFKLLPEVEFAKSKCYVQVFTRLSP